MIGISLPSISIIVMLQANAPSPASTRKRSSAVLDNRNADPAGTVDRVPDQLGQVETWCGALQCPLQGVVAGREDPGMEPVVRAIHGHQHGDDSTVVHTQVSPAQPSLSAVHKARPRILGQASQVGCGTLATLPSALCEIARRGAKTLADEDILDTLRGSLQLGPPDAEAAAGLGRDRDAITTHPRRRRTPAASHFGYGQGVGSGWIAVRPR